MLVFVGVVFVGFVVVGGGDVASLSLQLLARLLLLVFVVAVDVVIVCFCCRSCYFVSFLSSHCFFPFTSDALLTLCCNLRGCFVNLKVV